jgi:hypothetical protein
MDESFVGDDPSYEGGSGVGDYGSVSPGMPGSSDNDTGLTPAQVREEIYAQGGGTATNPFPNSFFSQLFGVDRVSYVDQFGGGKFGLANIAIQRQLNRDRYMNPLDSEGNIRPDLEGELTRLGRVIKVDKPQTTGQTIARTLFSAATPIGPILSLLGKTDQAIAPNFMSPQGINYDPTLDPNNPAYQGPQDFLGQLGKGIESITFGGARPITETSKGIMSLYEAQDAKRAMGGYETFDGQRI